MKTLIQLLFTASCLMLQTTSVKAETTEDYHPFLSEKFSLGLGVFWPKVDFDIRVDGTDPSEDIDFDEVFNFSDYQTSPVANFRWRFGEKWSLFGQYWGADTSGKSVISEDVKWEDIIFRKGTSVGGGVGVDVVRVFVGRQFDLSPQHELGIGIGLHWMSLDTFIEGEILINDDEFEFYADTAVADFPLPNIGAWYMYSWSPKWVLQMNIDWLSATFGNYSGSIWDAQVGINYQATKHFGFGLHYKGFILDVDVDKTAWHGKAKYAQAGPMLSMTASW